ncbi:MAG: tRNA dihydrouridine(20/20a) synthase DusA [Alphaproteobacteria bacterium]|nr:tRNA dihydrouridine(20/20a) synthase DusA [Alphaproteobacteria bacterium]
MSHRFCVAPMMDWTDRHCRAFHRHLTRRARLYTEMVTAPAVIHGDRTRLLGFAPEEHPLALQLGGADPAQLAEAARIAEGVGYDEINLNVGCPSDRVQSGRFGACLMAEPHLVARCLEAMRKVVALPVTVKCRIGIDDQDPEQSLRAFLDAVEGAGVTTIIVHARKAWLDGLSPKENRDIPPLDYPLVRAVKRERPHLTIVINGGIASLDEARAHLETVDGVMLGRAAYQTPFLLADVDAALFGEEPGARTPADILAAYRETVARELARGVPLAAMTRHVLGLSHGLPGGRRFRRHLAENAHRPGAGLAVYDGACAWLSPARADAQAAA